MFTTFTMFILCTKLMLSDIEKQFNEDIKKLLKELKVEELANLSSANKIEFLIRETDHLPSAINQRRILGMLNDKKIITIIPFYHKEFGFNDWFRLQGAEPIGYHITVVQPTFDDFYKTYSMDDDKYIPKAIKPAGLASDEVYFITKVNRKIILNNKYILSIPDFDGENDNFMDFMINNQNKKISKEDFTKNNRVLKKNFVVILSNLGFSGEIKKIFFEVSKNRVYFRNNIRITDIEDSGINFEKLEEQISKLKTI